jgi:hypothetical protein
VIGYECVGEAEGQFTEGMCKLGERIELNGACYSISCLEDVFYIP